jgi:hypothetical protein
MRLAELGHAAPLPALEHPGGVARRRIGVAFDQHHLMAARPGVSAVAEEPAWSSFT